MSPENNSKIYERGCKHYPEVIDALATCRQRHKAMDERVDTFERGVGKRMEKIEAAVEKTEKHVSDIKGLFTKLAIMIVSAVVVSVLLSFLDPIMQLAGK